MRIVSGLHILVYLLQFFHDRIGEVWHQDGINIPDFYLQFPIIGFYHFVLSF